MSRKWLLAAAHALVLLGACGKTPEPAAAPPAAPAPPPSPAPAPPAAPAPAAAPPQVTVTSPAQPPVQALASGKIKSSECCSSERIELDQVSYIDDATAKKFTVLKDEAGQWLAAPLDSRKKMLKLKAYGGISKTWMKFPAPPAESKTVSINMPHLGALDGIAVQR
jgi:hypothetical protein